MQTRTLTRLSVTPGAIGALDVADALSDALTGDGPAIALIPAGPASYVDRITAAIRPDDPNAPLESAEVAVVLTTSGSAGKPRGVLLTAAALTAAAHSTARYLGAPARWVLALPVHHIGGLQVLIRSRQAGLPPIPLESIGGGGHFSPAEFVNASRAARSIADTDGSALRTAIVPTQLARILRHGEPGLRALQCFDTVLIGGGPIPPELLARCRQLGIPAIITYGMTEMCGGCVYDGQPLQDITVCLADVDGRGRGRIELAGPQVALGYRLEPELTMSHFRDGRFLTSDCGYFGDAGLIVTGRVDDHVQVGGESVSLRAVEEVVQSDPRVAEVAVVAVPCEDLGARLIAFVVGAKPPGQDPPTDAQLCASIPGIVRGALGAGARPRTVTLLPELPELPNGKIDRTALRESALQAVKPVDTAG